MLLTCDQATLKLAMKMGKASAQHSCWSACRRFAKVQHVQVIIVTNAMEPWVETSCRSIVTSRKFS